MCRLLKIAHYIGLSMSVMWVSKHARQKRKKHQKQRCMIWGGMLDTGPHEDVIVPSSLGLVRRSPAGCMEVILVVEPWPDDWQAAPLLKCHPETHSTQYNAFSFYMSKTKCLELLCVRVLFVCVLETSHWKDCHVLSNKWPLFLAHIYIYIIFIYIIKYIFIDI